jgi:hypothetical protein
MKKDVAPTTLDELRKWLELNRRSGRGRSWYENSICTGGVANRRARDDSRLFDLSTDA